MSRLERQEDVAQSNEYLRDVGRDDRQQWLAERLYDAFLEARRGKLDTTNQQRFEENRDNELVLLAEEILDGRYTPSRSVAFIITEPTAREIFAASFRDRVVHHFLIQQTGHFWDKRLSPRSFSCREGKGTLYGIRRLERDIRNATHNWKDAAWVMKIDLQGYFMSLPRQYLFERVCWGLERQFPRGGPLHDVCMFLWEKVLFDDPLDGVRIKGSLEDWRILPPSKSMFNSQPGRGIVIGNLTSQWASNMALDPLDRYVCVTLGHAWYGRYVDDAYFVATTREELLEMRIKVEGFIHSLGLTVHPKKFYLQPASRGVPFLGVVVYPGRTVLGRRICRNMHRLRRAVEADGLSASRIDRIRIYRGISVHFNHKKTLDRAFGAGLLADAQRWYRSG